MGWSEVGRKGGRKREGEREGGRERGRKREGGREGEGERERRERKRGRQTQRWGRGEGGDRERPGGTASLQIKQNLHHKLYTVKSRICCCLQLFIMVPSYGSL